MKNGPEQEARTGSSNFGWETSRSEEKRHTVCMQGAVCGMSGLLVYMTSILTSFDRFDHRVCLLWELGSLRERYAVYAQVTSCMFTTLMAHTGSRRSSRGA